MKRTAIKKAAMLSAAALLALSGIAVSQAEEATPAAEPAAEVAAADTTEAAAAPAAEADATAAAESTEADATTEADAAAEGGEADAAAEGTDAEAAPVAAAAEEEPIPQDTPQVQKLMALYPKLIARIQPVGNVCFEGEDCDITVRAAGGSVDGEPRDGKAVYDAVCHTCHATGLLGSPMLGDAGAWGPRIGKGKDTLYNHAINGFNAMPAKGGADIDDEEVQNAVDYMITEAS
jgi:cytochrome c5